MPPRDIQNKKEFESDISKKKVLCLYHWSQCGHCHAYMPVWKKLMASNKINSISVELAVIKTLNPVHQIYAFPTVVLFENGIKKIELAGARSEKELHNFIKANFAEKPVPKTKSPTPTLSSPKTKKVLKK